MGIRVAVAGASGYAGGELLRLLAGHPDLEIGAVTAGTSAGKPITAIHPNLTGHPAFDGRDFQPTDLGTLGNAELIFMALPHGESAALARELPDSRIVDLSADFRLADEDAWNRFYGVPYAGRWARLSCRTARCATCCGPRRCSRPARQASLCSTSRRPACTRSCWSRWPS